jgi:predicted AAA+ superfamily ATPase
MQGYLSRRLEREVQRRLATAPVVAILGPRQCGKSTLAKHLLETFPGAVRLDLERPSERSRLTDPEAFFALHPNTLVCLDEVQRVPEIFPVLRSVVDERGGAGHFLVLGSASPELLRQSSETLAGRVAFLELTPFLIDEVEGQGTGDVSMRRWLRGGFPRSFLATNDEESAEWRADFTRTFLERDLGLAAPRIPAQRLERFWRMCAHVHAQTLNASRLASSLGVSSHTIHAYLDLLSHTFMVRLLPPLEVNLGKRLIRSPKLLLRDTGVLHTLLAISTHDELLGHPGRGASWEGFVAEQAITAFPDWRPSFFRTRAGAEIDLVLERGERRLGIECKASSAPHPSRGFWGAIEDLGLEQAYVVAPVREPFPLGRRAAAVPVDELVLWAPRIDGGERHPALGADG